jgi:pimeloyl-ACP methyl ester carboxylesterase
MTAIRYLRINKSTNVRNIYKSLLTNAMRLGIRIGSYVVPGPTEDLAARLFLHPPRKRRPPLPEVPGLPARRLTVPSGRYDLAAWSWGEGPAVLLVPGWMGSAAQMTPFVAPLVATGHRVVTFDPPAHGHSSGRTAAVPDARDAVVAVAGRCGPLQGVVAHSVGGTAAALALVNGLRMERAALIAPAAELGFFVRSFARTLGFTAPRAESVVHRVYSLVGVPPEALDLRLLRPRHPIPLLVLHDPQDATVPFAHGQAIAATWPRATLRPLEGLGHRRMLADPETVEAVVRFVSAERGGAQAARAAGE